MTVYVVAQLKFTNRPAYDRYQAAFFEVFRRFSGRVLAADESPVVLEGQWARDKVVILSFPDEAGYRSWAESPGYEAIAKDRRAGAQAVILLVHGLHRAG